MPAVSSTEAHIGVFDHPLQSLLSALHHARIYIDIAVVIVVLGLTNLIAHFTTAWAGVVTVPVAAVQRDAAAAHVMPLLVGAVALREAAVEAKPLRAVDPRVRRGAR